MSRRLARIRKWLDKAPALLVQGYIMAFVAMLLLVELVAPVVLLMWWVMHLLGMGGGHD